MNKTLSKVLAGVGLAIATSASQAALVQFVPASDSAPTGGVVSFGIQASEFTVLSAGAAVDISWLAADELTFLDWAVNPALGADPFFDIAVLGLPGSGLVGVGFGSVSATFDFSTPTILGTVSFRMGNCTVSADPATCTAGTAGIADLTMTDGTLAGNGFLDETGVGFITVDYSLANAQANTVVPVPAAVWLFGSGLLGLVGVARRKNQHA